MACNWGWSSASAIDQGSWVAPQLAVVLSICDPQFVGEAKQRITSGVSIARHKMRLPVLRSWRLASGRDVPQRRSTLLCGYCTRLPVKLSGRMPRNRTRTVNTRCKRITTQAINSLHTGTCSRGPTFPLGLSNCGCRRSGADLADPRVSRYDSDGCAGTAFGRQSISTDRRSGPKSPLTRLGSPILDAGATQNGLRRFS
jgi:hypothetical protein